MVDPAAREREVAELLDAWPWDHGGVVIGGYAISAYGKPRYSDDLDVLIPVEAFEPLDAWLDDRGFDADEVPDDLPQNYAGQVARYRLGDVTVDLLPGVVRDREAQVDVPEAWLSQDPREMRLFLLDASTESEVPVARPEALWVLKLQSGRPQDLADLFAIRDEDVDLGEVRGLFEDLWCATLSDKLDQVAERLEDSKLYRDTLSRLALGSPRDEDNRKEWTAFQEQVRTAIPDDPG